ncbi:MAG: hypothetical protein ACOY3H_08550 [Bacillota bacterium]
MPKTFFEVQVVENLKGNLGDKFIFRQDGAIDEKNNEKIIIENYDLLSPGQTYLFFLDKVPDKNNTYWSINGPFSVYQIDGDMAKNNTSPVRSQKLIELKK